MRLISQNEKKKTSGSKDQKKRIRKIPPPHTKLKFENMKNRKILKTCKKKAIYKRTRMNFTYFSLFCFFDIFKQQDWVQDNWFYFKV